MELLIIKRVERQVGEMKRTGSDGSEGAQKGSGGYCPQGECWGVGGRPFGDWSEGHLHLAGAWGPRRQEAEEQVWLGPTSGTYDFQVL